MLWAKDLAYFAHQEGLPAIGLTDSGHLFGALEFSLTLQKKGIQPLIGCTFLCVEEGAWDSASFPLVLFAQNEKGYHNLCRLVTDSTVGQRPEHRNRLRFEQYEGLTDGLLALSGGPLGKLDVSLAQEKKQQASDYAAWLHRHFPARWYLEISRLEATPQRFELEKQLIDWAYQESVPMIATQPAFYGSQDNHGAFEVLRCISQGFTLEDAKRPVIPNTGFLATPAYMNDLFSDLPEALHNTGHLMQRCHFLLKAKSPVIPKFPITNEETPREQLFRLSQQGLSERPVPTEKQALYQDRLLYECDMISKLGFADYFLIVSDFIQWAKNNRIPVGPGRGSGASSLVAWALKITDIDPIHFELFFERFLNPDRVSPPDFDVDFCQKRRDEVIDYVQNKYGKTHVAHIITFGKLQARMVLRDVGRVLGMPYGQVDKICKWVPHNPAHPVTLEEALEQEPLLREAQQQDPQVERLIAVGKQLEGLYRHASTHAAGIVISTEPLRDLVPLYQDPDAHLPATEFHLKYIDDAGLIKFDFLGLKNLTVMQHTVDLLAKRGIVCDLTQLPLDDDLTFSMLRRGETVGVFQLESGGMTDVLVKLQPERFEELIALVALYRPGPMSDIPRYIACRHGRETVSYPYPCLEPILQSTFGVMVYQEQVLQIARTLAGYSLGQADLLRRGMAKKIPEQLEALRKTFVEGVLANHGGPEAVASHLFDQITRFAGYAFPKAHATPYALIAYQTAYLKAHYPAEYFASLMTMDAGDADKMSLFAGELKHCGIALLSPHIAKSDAEFTPEPQEDGSLAIRFGLSAIKNVGITAVEGLMEARQLNAFDSLESFLGHVPKAVLNKRVLEGLILSGTLDTLNTNRRELFLHLPRIALTLQKTETPSLFEETQHIVLPEEEPWSEAEALAHERDVLGLYVSGHPLTPYANALKNLGCIQRSTLLQRPVKQAFLSGVLLQKQEKMSKKGNRFAILTLSDLDGTYEVMVFDPLLSHVKPLLVPGKLLYLQVEIKYQEGLLRFGALSVDAMAQIFATRTKAIYLQATNTSPDAITKLKNLLDHAALGQTQVILMLHVPHEERMWQIESVLHSGLSLESTLHDQLLNLFKQSITYRFF